MLRNKNSLSFEDEVSLDDQFNIEFDDISNAVGNCVCKHTYLIRCGLHTFQLAVYDSLKECFDFINFIRSIVKVLRNFEYKSELKRNHLNIPVLDVQTRWSSTYKMLKSFYDIIGFVQEKKKFDMRLKISDSEVEILERIVCIYKLAANFTTKMQSENVLLSEFYAEWVLLEEELKMFESSDCRDTILSNLKIRKEKAFGNKLYKLAIFLDPRYKELVGLVEFQCLKELHP